MIQGHLAMVDNFLEGHAALDLSDSRRCPEFVIFIQKGFRNVGIGTGLSQAMKGVAKDAGCEKVVLTVRTANRRAIKVFERVGFSFCSGIEACRDMELQIERTKTHRRKTRKK